ncbi:uncharacterized protein LOC120421572 [Culex pipiens pallens]|uniref:uncharacterized protein LOC120421572 n=1 Tax=Culex pipiens pallens TaxID=42434 RepID=UPI001954FA72|nr:uncharacterized protein LOC120421572 [Culex pipiens pallens]
MFSLPLIFNFILVVILICAVRLPFLLVHGEPSSEDASELSQLKEVFYKNLLADFRAEGLDGSAELSPEEEARMDQRIRGFVRSTGVGESGTTDRVKRESKNVDEQLIEADTAGGERRFLKGFHERGYVPVNFPLDICLLKVGTKVFAASLHIRKSKESYSNHTVVSFYVREEGQFQKFKEYTAILARNMDCISNASLGFVAIVNYYDNARNQDSPLNHRGIDDGSPIFQIQENGTTEIVQKFSQSNQNTVHMWTHGNHIYLTHTYTNLDESVANVCPLYRWSGYHFDAIDELPCYNSIHIEPFMIAETLFIAIANQMNDEAVDEDTFSDVFKFDYERQKFDFHQKIYVYSVSDIAYFFLDQGDVREHFLVTGNSRAGKKNRKKLDYDQHSIVYKFIDGFFVPFQKFELHRVQQFLPVMRENGEFLLLIRCKGKPLQIYEYDGWKFAPSRIDYTREAFAEGVSHMRVYRHIINASVIVIANKNLFGSTTNIFTPMYGVENDLKEVYGQFISWCGETTDRLSQMNLEEIYNKLEALPKVDDGTIKLDKDVEVKRSTVEHLRTKVLHTGGFVFDQRTFDYLNSVHNQLEGLKQKVEKLKAIIDDSLGLNETLEVRGDLKVPQVIATGALVKDLNARNINDERQPPVNGTEEDEIINVDRLIVDDRLSVKFLNGYASETLLRTNGDPRLLKDVDLYVSEVEVRGDLFVNNLIDGIRFTPDNVLINGADQTFSAKTMYVDHLVVKNLVTPKLNNTDVDQVTALIEQASKLRSRSRAAQQDYPSRLREIRVKNLTLTGLTNDVDMAYIDQYALKTVGDQVITAPFNFDNIVVDNVTAPNNRLSGIDLNFLVLTEPTSEYPDFKVRQDVQFLKPVQMDNVQLYDRINHIPVIDDELQVLLRDSKEPQLITGTKTFDYVELLGPIFLQGKINSSSLSKLNPVTTINQDVYLEGDFEITGDVTIERLLNTSNIFGASRTYNFVNLYEHGLPLNAVGSYQNFTFTKPLIVENAFTTDLNGLNPNDFIPINSDRVQQITGKKTFRGDLKIRGGHVDAAMINQVDLRVLNETVLKRTGDQVVEGTIHFKEVVASHVVAQETLFEGRPLDTLLTTDSKQQIKANVRMENCRLTVNGNLNVGNLEATNSTIFGYNLDWMFSDTLQRPGCGLGNETVLVTGPKRFQNVQVRELVLLDQASLNGVDLMGLQKISDPLEQDIVIEETLILKHPITVRNVFFNGSINGVRREEFGRAWLLNEYNQTFTAPQIFEHVIAERTYVDGFVNGVKLDELAQNVYYLDQNERVPHAIFHEGVVSYQPVTVNGLISGLNLATDVLLDQASDPQQLEEIKIDGNLLVSGEIHVSHTLNGMNYAKLREFTTATGSTPDRPMNVEVYGNAHFEVQPEIVTLNGYNLEQLHRDVWLANRDEVLTGNYRFENAHFASWVHAKGPINNLNLSEIAQTYLSVSKAQNVTTPLIFKGPVRFRKATSARSVELGGLLKGSIDSKGIDIVDFDKHVLKKDVPQTITGNWTFHNVEVRGPFNLTTLNGLDLRRDILWQDATEVVFTAPKQFDNLHVHNIICPDPCLIQGVDINEWFANSVRKSRNHTIEGVTTVEAATFLGDIEVLGLVNNVTFDREHLLLKSVPQTIKGDLTLRTKFPELNLIYPSSIEELEVETINGKNFDEFMANLARRNQETLTVRTPVTLTRTLQAQNVDTGNNTIFGVNINQLLREVEYGDQLSKYESKLRSLDMVGQSLVETLHSKTPYLSHYERIKPLAGRFRDVITITLPLSPSPIELLAAHVDDGNRTAVEFYRWNKKDGQFRVAKGFPPITSPNMAITNLKRISLGYVQHLFVEFYDPSRRSYRQTILDLEPPDLVLPKKTPKFISIYEFNSTVPRNVVSLRLLDLDCLGLFSPIKDGLEIHCLHLENLLYYMRFHQALSTPAVQQALHLDNRLVLLSRNDLLQVWRPQPNYQLTLNQLIKVHAPNSLTVAKFDHQLFIAVSSEPDPAVESAHHGSIQIWRDQRPSHANGTFTRYHTILTSVPKQIQFSVLPVVGELMLYTVKDDRFHPVVIYRYEGVSGFAEYLTSNVLRLAGRDTKMALVKLEGKQRELVALVTERDVTFIEGVVKGSA